MSLVKDLVIGAVGMQLRASRYPAVLRGGAVDKCGVSSAEVCFGESFGIGPHGKTVGADVPYAMLTPFCTTDGIAEGDPLGKEFFPIVIDYGVNWRTGQCLDSRWAHHAYKQFFSDVFRRVINEAENWAHTELRRCGDTTSSIDHNTSLSALSMDWNYV